MTHFKEKIEGNYRKKILQLKERKKYLKSILTFTNHLVKVLGFETNQIINIRSKIGDLDIELEKKIKLLQLSWEVLREIEPDSYSEKLSKTREVIERELHLISKEVKDASLESFIDEEE